MFDALPFRSVFETACGYFDHAVEAAYAAFNVNLMQRNPVDPPNSLCMPIVRMQTESPSLRNPKNSGISAENTATVTTATSAAATTTATAVTTAAAATAVPSSSPSSQPLGVIENPLFDRSSERNVQTARHSLPAPREMSGNNNASSQRRSLIQSGLRRSKTVKEYIAKNTASFFGLDNETEHSSYQRWTERRRRLLSKRWGEVKEETDQQPLHAAISIPAPVQSSVRGGIPTVRMQSPLLQPVITAASAATTDSVDGGSTRPTSSSSVENAPLFQRHRRKDSVYRIMVDSVGLITTTVIRRCSTRNFWPLRSSQRSDNYASENDSVFHDEGDTGLPSMQLPDANQIVDDVFFDSSHSIASSSLESVAKKNEKLLAAARLYLPSQQDSAETADSSRPGSTAWHRPPSQGELPSSDVGMKRIWDKYPDHGFKNFDRRQYGMGVFGRLFQRKMKQERITSDVKQQLDDLDDHRPFFTYWVTTVQILVTVICLAVYGFGPVGIRRTQRSGQVMVTSLHLQEVDYFEPDNFWFGPRPADLVHLGAKFTPCMRKDKNIFDSIKKDRNRERDTACCVRNDQSGCVQTTRDKCSKLISSWKKWDVMQPGPPRWMSDPNRIVNDHRSGTHRRLSGSVCGQDPRYCHEPASVYPYEWPDDITKWPVCKAVVPDHKAAEPHMACEIIGRPCCIGVYGQCQITTREYCDFVKGFFHEEAALCSQVSCLDDVCGMIPFHNPEVPDQFYRLWTSLFLHAGILHLLISVIIQYFIMADLEKLVGPVRIAIIYIMSGVGGNLASAIFVPYRAEVGPAGSQFGLLACLFVEVIHCWKMLKHPGMALLRLGGVALVLFLVGLLPWIDNYAHIFGFLFGFLFSYALLPFVSFGTYDRATKVILIWVCLIIVTVLLVALLLFFYVHPIYECSFCKYLNCIPLTRDFCENHDIILKRQEF